MYVCVWRLYEDVFTVPAVLSECFVLSGLVWSSTLSAVNRPSVPCVPGVNVNYYIAF